MHEQLAKEKKIAFVWGVEDVIGLDPSLTEEQAWEVLQAFEHHHEGSMESMWADLEFHISRFKEEL